MIDIAHAEEAGAAGEHVGVVFVPADAGAGAERIGEAIDDAARGQRGLKATDDERRAVLLGEQHRLLRGELVAAAVGQVVHVARGGVRVQPFAHVAFVRSRLRARVPPR